MSSRQKTDTSAGTIPEFGNRSSGRLQHVQDSSLLSYLTLGREHLKLKIGFSLYSPWNSTDPPGIESRSHQREPDHARKTTRFFENCGVIRKRCSLIIFTGHGYRSLGAGRTTEPDQRATQVVRYPRGADCFGAELGRLIEDSPIAEVRSNVRRGVLCPRDGSWPAKQIRCTAATTDQAK